MLKHIVLFKLKPSAEGASKEENGSRMKRDIEALKGKISLIRHIEVGLNAVPADAAYDVAIYSEFDNARDLETYAKHPEHLKVVEFVKKVVESRVVVDYLI